jgi:hypothetical protein
MYGHLDTGMRTSIELCVSVLALILGCRLEIDGLSADQCSRFVTLAADFCIRFEKGKLQTALLY